MKLVLILFILQISSIWIYLSIFFNSCFYESVKHLHHVQNLLLIPIHDVPPMDELCDILIELIQGVDEFENLVDCQLWVGDGMNLLYFFFEIGAKDGENFQVPLWSGEFVKGEGLLIEFTLFVDVVAKF